MKQYIPQHFRKLEDDFIYSTFPQVGLKAKMFALYDYQHGGAKYETIVKYIDKGGIYSYRVYTDTKPDKELNQVHIAVLTEKDEECVSFVINKNDGTVILHNMSYFKNCAIEGLRKPGGGSKLLRFALNLILQHREIYKIKKILLTDNSFLYCKGATENLKLAQLRLITHGETWYMKYGFRPIDDSDHKLAKNNKVINKIKTSDINIVRLVEKYKLKNIDIDELKHLMTQYRLFKDFIIRLSQEMNKYCQLIVHILILLYQTPGHIRLYDFSGKQFYLDI